jgi:hypothetical protein
MGDASSPGRQAGRTARVALERVRRRPRVWSGPGGAGVVHQDVEPATGSGVAVVAAGRAAAGGGGEKLLPAV